MYEQVEKSNKSKSSVVANSKNLESKNQTHASNIVDNRLNSVAQQKLEGFKAVQNYRSVRLNALSNNCDSTCNKYSSKTTIQNKMESDSTKLIMTPTAAPAISGFTTALDVSACFDSLTKTSSPDSIPEMNDTEVKQVISDPSKGDKQNLTKMHLIRGKFGGPGSVDNLKLGTAYSNLHSAQSHYNQVERPITEFINGAPKTRAVDYHVSVGNPANPAYIAGRLANAKKPTTDAFAKKMCPSTFLCEATFYQTDGVSWKRAPLQQEIIPLDLIK